MGWQTKFTASQLIADNAMTKEELLAFIQSNFPHSVSNLSQLTIASNYGSVADVENFE